MTFKFITGIARYCRSRLQTAIDRQFQRRRRLETAPTTASARLVSERHQMRHYLPTEFQAWPY